MPNVWLTHETDQERDLSSAHRYGTLRPLLSQSDRPGKTPGPAIWKIFKALKENYQPEDYICIPGGDPLAALLTGAALAMLNVKEVNFLRYERERALDGSRTGAGFYVPITCKLPWGLEQ